MNFFKRLTDYLRRRPKIINKIAFFINEEYLFDHYTNVIRKLEIDSFEIIFADKFRQNKHKDLVNKIKSYGWNVVFLKDVFYQNKYKILLTHMYLGGNTLLAESLSIKFKLAFIRLLKKIGITFFKSHKEQFFQKKLGIYNIKFMYGVDVNRLDYQEYDNVFNEFFCHGPRVSQIIKKNFHGKIFEMGYPRYDNYFQDKDNEEIKNNLLKKYSCSSKKPTILWICSISRSFSTILTYEKYIEKLTDKYNVILRPHPMEIDPKRKRFRQKVLDIVTSEKFLISKNPSQKMTELYLISDYVFCDYGGSIFSALYCNKNILLMNHQNMAMDRNIYQSTALEIRDYLPSINEKDCNDHFIKKIDNILSSSQNLIQLRKARKVYFGDKKNGNCSYLVSNKLKELLRC